MSTDFLANSLLPMTVVAAGAIGNGIIWNLLIGLVVGIVAKIITPGNEPVGCIITSIIGIAGAMIALFIGKAIGFYQEGQTPGFIGSVVGAVLLLAIYHLTIGKKRPGA